MVPLKFWKIEKNNSKFAMNGLIFFVKGSYNWSNLANWDHINIHMYLSFKKTHKIKSENKNNKILTEPRSTAPICLRGNLAAKPNIVFW